MKSTTTQLELRLLGKPQVQLNGQTIASFRTAKAEALLYYLAVTGRRHSRESLANLLWGEMPEAKAKRNLTQVLSLLRKQFEPYLEIEAQHIGFKVEATYWLDVAEFERAFAADNPEEVSASLQKAVDLYQDDFLAGFYVKEALVFEEWVLTQRERLRELMIQALDSLINHHLRQANYPAGIELAGRLLTLEPWRETTHRQMMKLLVRNGRREAALAQYQTCRQVLAEELGVEPMSETTTLYERLKAAATPPPHNLPPFPNTFIGRETELQQIERHLADPACRLLTVVGPGGIGKSRLALEAARHYLQTDTILLEPNLTDGVYFVPLASIASDKDQAGSTAANAMITAIADSLKIPFQGASDLRSQFINVLRTKTLLLVLDNYEHLLTGGDDAPGYGLLTDILQQAPQVKLVVTSRERLNIQEEWVLTVEGLTYPGEDWHPSLNEVEAGEIGDVATPQPLPADLQHYSALALFVQRAEQTLGFTLPAADLPDVVQICQLVEGMPLALELAASWLRTLSCAEIVTEIERSLNFLETPWRNIPQRHRSLRAVFEHSWTMLSGQEQGMFAKLSVFRGGFTREAATKVAGVSPAILARLVDKSLLYHTTQGRYHLHELLRQYATEKLWGLGDVIDEEPAPLAKTPEDILAIWRRYSHYYLSFTGRQAKLLSGNTPQQATTAMRLDMANIRQAWQWAVTEGWIAELEPAIEGLARFYDQSGLFQEGELISGQAAAFFQTHTAALGGQSNQAHQAIIGRLWIEQARFLVRRGSGERALEIATNTMNLAETLQDPMLTALAVQQQGESLYHLGDYPAAQRQLERALALAQTVQLPALVSRAQLNLGIVAQYQSHFTEAQSWLEQARQGFQALDDQRSLNLVLLNLGTVAFHRGDHPQARQIFEQALIQANKMDDLWVKGMVLNNLGVTAYEEGRYSQAQAVCQQALHLARQVMDLLNETYLLHSLGNISRDQGNFDEARRYYHQGLALSCKRGDRDTESYVLADLGLLLHYQGNHDAACEHCLQAALLAEELKIQVPRSLALTHLGHTLLALGSAKEAGDAYQQAVALRREFDEHHRVTESLAGLAASFLAQGEMSLALAEVEAVLAYLTEQPLTGIIEPFRVYLTCYRVLQANEDPRAEKLLTMAHNLLQARAAAIEDERLRRSYLENIAPHREIIKEFNRRKPVYIIIRHPDNITVLPGSLFLCGKPVYFIIYIFMEE